MGREKKEKDLTRSYVVDPATFDRLCQIAEFVTDNANNSAVIRMLIRDEADRRKLKPRVT